jgi:NDP-sugar pyrophosphorylase family protein
MRAVILAGGKGTRLRPYTTVLPKPLVPVGDRPILELIIRQLARCGFTSVDLSVGHLGELVRAYLTETDAAPAEVELRYFWEDEPMGTAGALRLIDPPEEQFLVMNGDILTTLDYAELMSFHRRQGGALTIATHKKDVSLELGVIEGGDGIVADYIEKPTLHYRVSMGIYIYTQAALEHVPDGKFDFPDLVLALLAAGERVTTFEFDGPWFDIGTVDEHERAVAAFSQDPERFEPS